MATTIILYATPFFFLLIAIEMVVNHKRNANVYRTNDSIMSLSLGLISQTQKLVILSFAATVYDWIANNYAFSQFSVESPAIWVISFVLYDFLYYWFHRMAHQINFFWAGHVVHHQSEEYNLTTALRQSSSSLMTWLFYIPSFIIGIPAEVFFVSGALNLIYQYWVHTQLIGRLGWFESVFVTPSHHRVHHGQNTIYIDKNHGGVFILWDRIFGTFQEELSDEKVIYGVRRPIHSLNPIWANFHTWFGLFNDAVRAKNWRDKLRIWFMPTGWRPLDVSLKYPMKKTNPEDLVKYDPKISNISLSYSLFQYASCVLIGVYFVQTAANYEWSSAFLIWGLITLPLVTAGMLNEGRATALFFDILRLVITVCCFFYFLNIFATWQQYMALGYLSISLLFMVALVSGRKRANAEQH